MYFELVFVFDRDDNGVRFGILKRDPVMIFYSSSRSPQAALRKQISYLKKGLIDPSLHYRSQDQSKAWNEVFQAHCPVLSDPSFTQIYQNLFSRFAQESWQKSHLIGLGCGTGIKEQWLARSMKRHGLPLHRFSAVDVSETLCKMSMKRVRPFSVQSPQAWVIDLEAVEELRKALDQGDQTERRIYTFFGLVPNLAPRTVLRILKSLLRPQDQLLISANLAPVRNETEAEEEKAVKRILPQYRNRETKEWLSLLFQEQGISRKVISSLKFEIEKERGLRSVVVRAEVIKDFEWELGAKKIQMKKGGRLTVFQSRRWTPLRFEGWMKRNGFNVKGVEMTANREEAVWWVER